MQFSKCLLIFINVFYVIISVLLVAGSTIAKIVLGHYNFLSDGFSIFSILWIATGCCLLLIAIFGVIIAFGENTILLNAYALILSAVIIRQLSAAVAGFSISMCRSKEIISDTITSLIESYDHNDTSREAMDWMQTKYQCCGVKSPEDWNSLRYSVAMNGVTKETDALNDKKSLPISCCTREISENSSQLCAKFSKNGCLAQMHEIVSQHVTIISSFALIMAIVQIIGVFAAYVHIKSIKNSRKLDEIDYTHLKTKEHNFY